MSLYPSDRTPGGVPVSLSALSSPRDCRQSAASTDRTPAPRTAGATLLESTWTLSGFPLDQGDRLARLRVAYRLAGPERAPVVVVLGGISAHRRAVSLASERTEDGWWQSALGEEGADLCDRYRLLTVDWLGGPDQTIARVAGSGGEGLAYLPVVTTRDQARVLVRLLDHLGITDVHAVVSASYGGMVAQHLVTALGSRLGQAVIMACAHRPDAMALARRHVQREILRHVEGPRGVALARALAMTTYRSGAEFNHRFGGDDGARAVAGYLDHQGQKFARRFDAQSYGCLMDSIDAHRHDPGALATPVSLLGFTTDELCPPGLLREFADGLPALRHFDILDTPYGHDAFLCENERVAAFLHKTLDGEYS